MNYKIVLFGDKGVGKTTFLKRHLTGEFSKSYIATLGVDVIPLRFNTNYGPLVFNVWDCAGDEKFKGLDDGYYINADGAILMFDQSSEVSPVSVGRLHNKFTRVSKGPVILCGSKYDTRNPESINEIGNLVRTLNLTYYDISSKSDYNYDKPFLTLARKLTKKPNLVFQ